MASLAPGTLLGEDGRYCIIKELNRGGTAVVYEALDRSDGGAVALKVMDVAGGQAAAQARAVERELLCAAALRHPSIVRLLGFFPASLGGSQLLVLVWELVRGMDLLDLLNSHSGRLAEPLAASLFLQLARGVAFIHANGLVHRDLKPENAVVDASGRLKIIDFGLSKRQESAVTLGVGTPDYFAPELLGSGDLSLLRTRQTGRFDATLCDAWAVGVTLYLLVAGRYPFEDPAHPSNVVLTLQNVMAGRARPLPAHVSPACADLIGRLLARDPAQRIGLAEALAHPFLAGAVAAEAAAEAAAAAQAEAAAGQQQAQEQRQEEEEQAAEEAACSPSSPAATIPALPADPGLGHTPSFAFPGCQHSKQPTPGTPKLAAAPSSPVATRAPAVAGSGWVEQPRPAKRGPGLFACGWFNLLLF